MIDACDMTETAKALARKIFRIIGEAEAKALRTLVSALADGQRVRVDVADD